MRSPWIVLGYVVVSATWILLSDAAVEALFTDRSQLQWAQTLKGWAFVAVSGLLIGALLIPYERRQRAIARNLEFALRLSDAVNGAPNLATALREGLRLVVRDTRWSLAEVWLPDTAHRTLRRAAFEAAAGLPATPFCEAGGTLRLAVGEGLPGRAWAQQAPVWSADVRTDERFLRRDEARRAGLVTGIAYPLHFDDELVAVIVLFADGPVSQHAAYNDMHLVMANNVAASIAAQRAGEALRTLNQELERRVRERTRDLDAFARTASHDLKAPVRAVQGFTRAIRADGGDALGHDVRGHLEAIEAVTREMSTLIDGILAYSRASQDDITVEAVALDTVFDAVLDDLHRRRPEAAAWLHVERPLPVVRGSLTALRLVFGNLIDNAITYVSPGTTPAVRVTASVAGAGVHVAVRDNGIGVPDDARQRIFEPFERLHAPESYPGTGIGLASTRRAIERLGGAIDVSSAPDGGSVFTVWLPERVAVTETHDSESAASERAGA